jgi:hypothetical protein
VFVSTPLIEDDSFHLSLSPFLDAVTDFLAPVIRFVAWIFVIYFGYKGFQAVGVMP